MFVSRSSRYPLKSLFNPLSIIYFFYLIAFVDIFDIFARLPLVGFEGIPVSWSSRYTSVPSMVEKSQRVCSSVLSKQASPMSSCLEVTDQTKSFLLEKFDWCMADKL